MTDIEKQRLMAILNQSATHTINDVLTAAKRLGASGFVIEGTTTPEGWPFALSIVIASPGNEAVLEIAKDVRRRLIDAGAPEVKLARKPE